VSGEAGQAPSAKRQTERAFRRYVACERHRNVAAWRRSAEFEMNMRAQLSRALVVRHGAAAVPSRVQSNADRVPDRQ